MSGEIKRFDQWQSLIKAFADPCDGTIYHYTSAEGLRGIIENSEIRLTNVDFVNDTRECRALKKEGKLFDDSFSNEYVRDEWNKFINPKNTTYVASFSMKKNQLEQWRAYGNFCIGFNVKELDKFPFNLYKCVYYKKDIKEWILEKEKLGEWQGDCLNDQYKRGAAHMLIYAASKKYKDKYFEGEGEIRLVVESNHAWDFPDSPSMYEKEPPIHYRDHPIYKMPIPYVKFFIGSKEEKGNGKETYREMKARKLKNEKNSHKELLPITEIFIGPMAHQKEAKIACEILLRDNGYDTEHVKIKVSKIPYRGF